jgi:hypothetical protein
MYGMVPLSPGQHSTILGALLPRYASAGAAQLQARVTDGDVYVLWRHFVMGSCPKINSAADRSPQDTFVPAWLSVTGCSCICPAAAAKTRRNAGVITRARAEERSRLVRAREYTLLASELLPDGRRRFLIQK